MIRIHFNREESTITIESKGAVSYKEMLEAPNILTREDIPNNIKILEDASEAEPVFSDDKIPEIVQNLITKSAHLSYVKHAVIQRTPINTAISMMAERRASRIALPFKNFLFQRCRVKMAQQRRDLEIILL